VEVLLAAPQQQAGAVGSALAEPLAVRVQTRSGAAVQGVAVTWEVTGGGTLSSSATLTDTLGVARAEWTLGPAEGTQTAKATVSGSPPVTFTALAAAPARLERLSGDGQTAAAGAPLSERLVVRVVDAAGVPVRGARVAWEVTAGGGSATADAASTDALGLASAHWQLGALTVIQWVHATAGAAEVVLGATATGVRAASISADPTELLLQPGAARDLTARVKDAAGQTLPDQAVSWTTSNAAVARVSTAGAVTAMADGAATITASRDGKEATVPVVVDGTPPTITKLAFTPNAVDVSGGPVPITVNVGAADAGSGINTAMVNFVSPNVGQSMWCSTTGVLSAGTPAAGELTCTAIMRAAAEPGPWTVSSVYLRDRAENFVTVFGAELGARGFPMELSVKSATPDVVAPEITALSLSPNAVHVGAGPAKVDVMLTIKDAGTGVFYVAGALKSPSGKMTYCDAGPRPSSGSTHDGTWTCTLTFFPGAESGTWRLDVFGIDDAAGNRRNYWEGEWAATGFPTTVTVSP
jgi:hypothetical protein